ncbi:MAG: lysine--tRNA ligase [Oligoflexales bacterium]
MKPLSPHWADTTVVKIVSTWGDLPVYTVASGITPSGTVHIGNFREVITTYFVARALHDAGKKVRFIYSWDNFDTFRKVPKNLPNQEMLEKNLRHPISRLPDPHGKAKSYADYNIKTFESELKIMGIAPEFLYQEDRYAAGTYAEAIRKALEQNDKIKAILNEYRSSPLEDTWLPTTIYCEKCDRDQMDYERYDGEWNYSYKCSLCHHETTTDIRKTRNLKLNWRADWPMRWHHENVQFEPGGKDHSTEGGSFDTGKKISQEVWNQRPPVYLQYDFVSAKGKGGKMSSSSGDVITLSDALEIYEPQMIRWIFADQRPNHDFSISFDQDVIKTYEEFDKIETMALGPVPEKEGKFPLIKRTYELSVVGPMPKRAPIRPAFRELCDRLQICDMDSQRAYERFYSSKITDASDVTLFHARAEKAKAWLERYAPKEFRYTLRKTPNPTEFNSSQKQALNALSGLVKTTNLDSIETKDLNQLIYDEVIRKTGCDSGEFFKAVYQCLIDRESGPRLPQFIKEIGKDRFLTLVT